MPFVNEYISPDDARKFDLEDRNAELATGTGAGDWTIDHDRAIYLRHISRGRDIDTMHESLWDFHWKGTSLTVRLDIVNATGRPGGAAWTHWRLVRLNGTNGLPSLLKPYRHQILDDLTEALRAYKDNGVLSKSTDFEVTLDIDESCVL